MLATNESGHRNDTSRYSRNTPALRHAEEKVGRKVRNSSKFHWNFINISICLFLQDCAEHRLVNGQSAR